jgi:hypothetical protein
MTKFYDCTFQTTGSLGNCLDIAASPNCGVCECDARRDSERVCNDDIATNN